MRCDFIALIRPVLAVFIALCCLQACSRDDGAAGGNAAHRGAGSESSAPTREELANLTYNDIFAYPVTLENGRWEGEAFVHGGTSRPAVELAGDLRLVDDLDGDGAEEVVVMLWQTSGGSGEFIYLAVAGRRGDEIVNLGTVYLGDRVQLRDARTGDGRIVLDVVQQGNEDPACCPSMMATRSWVLTNHGLEELEMDVTGTLSLADLGGQEWVLDRNDPGESASRAVAITLTFEEQGLAGFAGCNRYFARVQTGDMPGQLTVGHPTGTRKNCEPNLMVMENRYLDALQRTRNFSFFAGKLVLFWSEDDISGTLLFTRAQSEK